MADDSQHDGVKAGVVAPSRDEHPPVDLADRDGEDITYLPGPGDPSMIRWRGLQFEAGVPLIVRNKWHIDAAKINRHFRVGPPPADKPKGD